MTTFSFAFSGGQNLMAAVVNAIGLMVIGLGALVATVTWRLRSPRAAITSAAISTGAGWAAAFIVEWVISFWLGAG